MAAEIRTVLGPISPERLGFTSMHEHVLLDLTVYRRLYEDRIREVDRALWPEPLTIDALPRLRTNALLVRDNLLLDDEEHMAVELDLYREAGGAALLDLSVVGKRTDMAGVRRCSEASGVHVVASTGFYIEPAWPEEIRGWSDARFEQWMVEEIDQGIGDTGVRAGHIKIGITDLSDRQRDVLTAAARAACATGVAVTVHPGDDPSCDGLAASEILIREGMDPDRVVIAHTDNRITPSDDPSAPLPLNIDHHLALLDRGVNISLDAFGMVGGWESFGFRTVHDHERIAAVVALAGRGYGGQIVIGADIAYKTATFQYGGPGYRHLPAAVEPLLRLAGVPDGDVRKLTVDTPARILTIH